ncbi:MAG: adenylate/guanylate cyclase domain-containing protein [Pseudomonadota bacterium]
MILKKIFKSLTIRTQSTIWSWSLGFVLLIGALLVFSPARPVIDQLELFWYDIRFHIFLEKEPAKSTVVIVDIDEASLKTEGRWPWPRHKVATLAETIRQAGATVVGFDVVFAESEINLIDRLLAEATWSDAEKNNLSALKPVFDGDSLLAKAFNGETILGFVLHEIGNIQAGVLPKPVLTLTKEAPDSIKAMTDYTGIVPKLLDGALGAGFISQAPDIDGSIRRVPMLLRVGHKVYPSLSLEMVRNYLFEEEIKLSVSKVNDSNYLNGIEMGSYFIPTDEQAQMLVPFLGPPRTFTYVSATDVMRGINSEILEGAIVLIGTSAFGLNDLRKTVMSPNYPGVEVHASLIQGLLDYFEKQKPLRIQPDFAKQLEWLTAVLCIVILGWIFPRISPVSLVTLATLLIIFLISSNALAWKYGFLDLPLIGSLLIIFILSVLNLSIQVISEYRQRKMITRMFAQYVPPEHVAQIVHQGGNITLDGETRMMSVLFSDIRGFTSISEKLSATELKAFLNLIFNETTGAIFEYSGAIDKYVGDMVMAFWGAPLIDAEHADHAVGAALAMLKAIDQMQNSLHQMGYPDVKIGIGINTGLMNVGDMGSRYRLAYTVLGDAVNLASRLESLTKFYGVSCLVGEDTMAQATSWTYRRIDRLRVKGKAEAVNVFEPVGRTIEASEDLLNELQQWEIVWGAYQKADWDQALQTLNQLQVDFPERELYALYVNRIESLKDKTTLEWDGIYTHNSK